MFHLFFIPRKNRISNKEGINNLIPFTEKELNVNRGFKSHFLLDFMAGKIKADENESGLIAQKSFIPQEPMTFSAEAQAVLDAGRALYAYYHQIAGDEVKAYEINENAEYLQDAAFYDIKDFFQGRSEKGRMKNKSDNKEYMQLLNDLKIAQKALAQKIEPKIYEYGFLLD